MPKIYQRRNNIGRKAGLPPLSIVKELRRMKQQDEQGKFERFEADHRETIWDAVLKPRREAEGDPNWRPKSYMEGMGFQRQVRKILWQKYRASTPTRP